MVQILLILISSLILKKLRKFDFFISGQRPSSIHIVELNSNKKIISISEKPIKPKSNLAITGIYIFDKNVIFTLKNLKNHQEVKLKSQIY